MNGKHPSDKTEEIAAQSLADNLQNNEESTTNEKIHNQPSPDGGYGWLVMIISTIIIIISQIMLYTFSVFYIEFTDAFQKSKAEIGILLSLIYFFLFGIGK